MNEDLYKKLKTIQTSSREELSKKAKENQRWGQGGVLLSSNLTEATDTQDLIERIYIYIVKMRSGVSFAELDNKINGFSGGDRSIQADPDLNICIWDGMTQEATTSMIYLLENNFIKFKPADVLIYVMDGGLLKMPIAKQKRNYKEMHWLPTTIDAVLVSE